MICARPASGEYLYEWVLQQHLDRGPQTGVLHKTQVADVHEILRGYRVTRQIHILVCKIRLWSMCRRPGVHSGNAMSPTQHGSDLGEDAPVSGLLQRWCAVVDDLYRGFLQRAVRVWGFAMRHLQKQDAKAPDIRLGVREAPPS